MRAWVKENQFLLLLIVVALVYSTRSLSYTTSNNVVAESKKGSFAITPYLGHQWFTIDNPSGAQSGYLGLGYGAIMTAMIVGDFSQGLGVGLLYGGSHTEHQSVGGEKLFGSEYAILGEFHVGSGFFLDVSYGKRNIVVQNTNNSSSYDGNVLGVGLGLSLYDFSPSWDVTIQTWYRQGLASPRENSTLSSVVGDQSVDVFVGLRWTPVITYFVPK